MLEQFKPDAVVPDKLAPVPLARVLWGGGIFLSIVGAVFMILGVGRTTPVSVAGPVPAPVPTPAPTPAPPSGMTQQQFDGLRDELAAMIMQGPNFSGTAFQAGAGEWPVTATIAWDNVSKRAAVEIDFLTLQRKIDVQGTIVVDKSNQGQVILMLENRSYDNNSTYVLRAASTGRQLDGTYRLNNGSGTLTLQPVSQDKAGSRGMTQEQFEHLRDELAAAVIQGPRFSGTAFQTGAGEWPVTATISWDDTTKRASGQITFLTTQRKIDVQGTILVDKEKNTEVVLDLENNGYDNNSAYFLKKTPSGQLGGTYRLRNDTGTLTLHPEALTPPPQASSAVTPVINQQLSPSPQPPPLAHPPAEVAPALAAIPGGTVIAVKILRDLDVVHANSETFTAELTAGLNLSDGQSVVPGTLVMVQVVQVGDRMGFRLTGIQTKGVLVPVNAGVLTLDIRADSAVATSNGNTTYINPINLFKKHMVRKGSKFTFIEN